MLYVYPALDEAKAAYQVWLDVRAKRDEILTEKHGKKPAPYRHVKVGGDYVAVAWQFIIFLQSTLGDCLTRPFFPELFMLGQSQAGHHT